VFFPRGATGDLFCCFQKHNPFGKSQRESKKGENYCPQFLTFVFFSDFEDLGIGQYESYVRLLFCVSFD
jgi:hypothetical protein